jgi:hypothetical protein
VADIGVTSYLCKREKRGDHQIGITLPGIARESVDHAGEFGDEREEYGKKGIFGWANRAMA